MQSIIAGLRDGDGTKGTLYAPLALAPPELFRSSSKVVLFVIDGLGHDLLLEVGAGGTLHEGLRGRITSVFPPTTATAITTFLTGLAPQQHALTGWFMWFKEVGVVAAPLPFTTRVGNVPLAGMGVDPHRLIGSRPIANVLDARCFMVQRHDLVDSSYSRAHQGEARVRGYRSMQGFFDAVRDIVRKNEHCYVYAYWPQLDALGHAVGVGAKRVRDHLRELDAHFAQFLETVDGSGATVVVTADHGFVDTTRRTRIELGDHPRLADTLVIPLCGEQRLAYCYVDPDKRDIFESYVAEELGEFCDAVPSEELVSRGYFGLGDPDPRLADRIGQYVLMMKDNYVIRQQLLGEPHPHDHVGVHGGTSDAEMYVPLVVFQT